ncbi:MAG TPA: NHL repeat-containing protein [Spirochaetota bacterium]|nr:NHL repeat-containing protein [Spirochaetota bacterium]
MIKRLSISASIILVLLCITGCDDSESGTGVENNPATATRVYGQGGSFTSGTANNGGISADSLSRPGCVVADSDGVYVADINNHRVLYFEGSSTTATRVYGQGGSFTSGTDNNGGISADSLYLNTEMSPSVAVDSGGVYIADTTNHRVLYYSGTSTTATRVYGQGNSFTSGTANNGGISADSLYYPSGVAVDSGGVYIVDCCNCRVLYYAGTSTTATRVYGQGGSFTTNTGNNGGVSASSLYYPRSIAVGSGGIYVADMSNMRVLYFEGTSTTATRVYGQGGSFTTNTGNNGGISADSLRCPTGVAVDSDGVYIADHHNSRLLFYSGTSTTATLVYGQGGNFTTDTANNGGISAGSLYYPGSVAVYSGRVYVADTDNNRVLFY